MGIEFIKLENGGDQKIVHISEIKQITEITDSEGYLLFMEILTIAGKKYNTKFTNNNN